MYCSCNQWNEMSFLGDIRDRDILTPPTFDPQFPPKGGDWIVTGRDGEGHVWVWNTKNESVWRYDPYRRTWDRY